MSLTHGFFNSVNGDRMYNAQQMASIFDGIINDGIFSSVGECFIVQPASGMTLTVGAGRAWFNSTWTYNDYDIAVVIPTSETILNRIDAVVLEINHTSSIRANSIKVIEGTPATSPVPPTLADTDDVHQYALAYVTVAAKTSTITAAMIDNQVGTGSTPFVTGILETASLEALFLAWQDQFEAWLLSEQSDFDDWFANLQYVLSGDVAGNLQVEIEALETRMLETSFKHYVGEEIPSSTLGKDGDLYAKTR